jgi:hypothetical protein
MEEATLLRDPHTFPTMEVLKDVLHASYSVYEELINVITTPAYGLVPEWRYYKDGKAWLCKVQYKKKTIFWLSVWDQYFKMTFYFTQATSSGVTALSIKKSLKEMLIQTKPTGKLIPLTLDIKKKEQLKDVLTLIAYKKSLK